MLVSFFVFFVAALIFLLLLLCLYWWWFQTLFCANRFALPLSIRVLAVYFAPLYNGRSLLYLQNFLYSFESCKFLKLCTKNLVNCSFSNIYVCVCMCTRVRARAFKCGFECVCFYLWKGKFAFQFYWNNAVTFDLLFWSHLLCVQHFNKPIRFEVRFLVHSRIFGIFFSFFLLFNWGWFVHLDCEFFIFIIQMLELKRKNEAGLSCFGFVDMAIDVVN